VLPFGAIGTRAGALAQPVEVTPIDALRASGEVIAHSATLSVGGGSGLFYATSTVARPNGPLPAQVGALIAAVVAAQSRFTQVPEVEKQYVSVRFNEATFRPVLEGVERFRRLLLGENVGPIDEIRLAVSQYRALLMQTPEGLGPEAASLLPAALSAEIGAGRLGGASLDAARQALGHYRQWIERMRSAQAGAIGFRRQAAEMAHDGGLSAVAQSHLGRRLGIEKFLLAGDQSEGKTADSCVIISRNIVTWQSGMDARGAVQITPEISQRVPGPLTPNVIVGNSRIDARDDSDLGVRLIRFRPGGMRVYEYPNYLFWPGIANQYCYIGRSETVLEPDAARERARALPGVKDDIEARARITDAVKTANAARVEIALCGQALALLEAVEGKIEWLHANDPL
jgi:hypothetical protein